MFAASETNSIKSSIEVADFTYCDDLDKMSVQSFDEGTTDFSAQIRNVKELGAMVFFIASPPTEAGRLLEQMYDSGLLIEGTQVVGNINLMHPDVIKGFLNPPNPPADRVKAIMRGVLASKFAPKVALKASEGGKNFVKSFSALPATAPVTLHGNQVPCSNRKDDTGKLVYQFRNPGGPMMCGGLDFSQFPASAEGENMADFTPYAYDAVYSFANAVKMILNYTNNDKSALTGDNFYSFLVNNVTIEDGATGYVKYFAGMPLYQFMASGDREEGYYYGVYNFQDAAYDATASTTQNGFVQVGRWNLEQGGLTRCTKENQQEMSIDSGAVCATTIQFRTKDNAMPSDSPPTIVVVMGPATRIFLLFFGALSLFLVLIAFGVTAYQRKSKLMRASHVHMVWATLSGCACAAARTVVAGVLSSDHICRARFVLGHLAFFATLLPLTWRMWRLTYLSNYKGLTRSKVTPRFVIQAHCWIMALVVVYLIIAAGLGQPHQSWTTSEVANQVTSISVCTLTHSEYEIALFALEAAVVIYANKVAQGVKAVPDPAQEKAYYSLAMTIIFALCILLWPIVSLINLPVSIQELIAGIGFFIAPLAVLLLVLGPKFWALYSDEEAARVVASVSIKPTADDDAGGIGMGLASLGKMFAFKGVAAVTDEEGGGKKSKAARQQLRELVRLADAGMAKKTYGEKVQLYRAQISKWQALRMQLDGTADDGVAAYSLKSRMESSSECEEDTGSMTVDQQLAKHQSERGSKHKSDRGSKESRGSLGSRMELNSRPSSENVYVSTREGPGNGVIGGESPAGRGSAILAGALSLRRGEENALEGVLEGVPEEDQALTLADLPTEGLTGPLPAE